MTPFNPLDMENLGESISNALLSSTPTPMADLTRFLGAGIYAIYYTGFEDPYRMLGAANQHDRFVMPIYVGKAVPSGARKGVAVATASGGYVLSSRLKQHASSIELATNLSISDFAVRWLVTEAIWIPLGESLLIGRFAPVWNSLIDGFGNHDPGAGRHKGVMSRWDALHPGRPWAERLAARRESTLEIANDAREYLRQRIQV